MQDLSSLGFTSFFQNQFRDNPTANLRCARIAAEHRNEYEYLSPYGEGKARLSGRLQRELKEEDRPGVGDWVFLDDTDQIERVLNRKTTLTRGSAGHASTRQVLAANVDIVFIVAGLDSPFNSNKVERYLSMAWSSGATPVVVLNKADVSLDANAAKTQAELHSPGVDVILASSKTAVGLHEIREFLSPGTTAVFVGPSGVGKSTLINSLSGEQRMETSDVRRVDGKGRHTTVHRQLILLPDGGLVIDTPGLRELQLAEGDGIASVFPEIEELSEQCRFRDCAHQSEPGCAVKVAVNRGELSQERYEHYLKLLHDAESFELRQNERLRRRVERGWGKLSREGKMIRRLKGDR